MSFQFKKLTYFKIIAYLKTVYIHVFIGMAQLVSDQTGRP